jgi:hypothetical protein
MKTNLPHMDNWSSETVSASISKREGEKKALTDWLTDWLTNYVELSPSSETNSHLPSQEIPWLLQNHVHKSLQTPTKNTKW